MLRLGSIHVSGNSTYSHHSFDFTDNLIFYCAHCHDEKADESETTLELHNLDHFADPNHTVSAVFSKCNFRTNDTFEFIGHKVEAHHIAKDTDLMYRRVLLTQFWGTKVLYVSSKQNAQYRQQQTSSYNAAASTLHANFLIFLSIFIKIRLERFHFLFTEIILRTKRDFFKYKTELNSTEEIKSKKIKLNHIFSNGKYEQLVNQIGMTIGMVSVGSVGIGMVCTYSCKKGESFSFYH